MRIRYAILFLLAALAVGPVWAWNPPKDTVGPLTVSITPIEPVAALEKPVPVTITLENKGAAPLTGSLRVGVVDAWRVEGPNPRPVAVPAGKSTTVTVNVVAGRGTHAALYPIHAIVEFAQGQEKARAHAIFIADVARAALQGTAARPSGLGQVVALRAVQPMAVDGKLDEWSNAIAIPLGEAQCSLGKVGAGDFGAVLMALHDGANLYLGLRVSDDEICAGDTTSADFVNSDYIRLYLAPTAPQQRKVANLSTEDIVLAINPLAGSKPLMKVPAYEVQTRSLADLSAVRSVARRTPGGYEYEMAVPLALIGAQVREGSALGMNLMIGDADSNRREGEVTIGSVGSAYWLTPRSYVALELSPRTKDDGAVQPPLNTMAGRGSLRLDRLAGYQVQIAREGKPVVNKPLGWTGNDPETGVTFTPQPISRPDRKDSISVHPPYRGGVGPVTADARFALPNIKPIRLSFATAIRDSSEKEGASDGVEWKVLVAPEGGEFQQVFQRFSKAKQWEPAEVDLSAFAGKTVTLRLWTGPGPAKNTSCDQGFWGEPLLVVGERTKAEPAASIAARRKLALARAQRALAGKPGPLSWSLKSTAGAFGAGIVPGPRGLVDAIFAMADAKGAVLFDGFTIAVAGEDLGDWRGNAQVSKVEVTGTQKVTIRHSVTLEERVIPVEARLWSEGGALKIAFAMPGVKRDERGQPRFTNLGLGTADQKARRVYAGFGNVIQDPERYTLTGGGFRLSTRHVGVDFTNGVSLVQACDVYPDRFEVDPDKRLYSLQTHHDATFLLVPSARGAFAAARVYRDMAGFKPAGGVEKLKGMMCIDWWGHNNVGADIRRAGAYGLTDSLFLMHNWQRWGYDYRLPDIYPPRSDPKVWSDWIAACRETGILSAVHDNYIDIYPDADDYSYKHIVFNADGTPQRAWYNRGRDAQSYRWLPHAFKPWLLRNIKLIKDGFAPEGYFIDVFTAMAPIDYYDESGRFYTKMETQKHWGEAFDIVRDTLGNNAPQLSEAGTDALIGHLDGAQSDHNSAKAWGWKGSDADRTPWHDMASHGSFILLAGGLGSRYAGDEPFANWASDDYLSNTVMGGRNPMCGGPCTRGTVMTYWLLHDICDQLAHQSLETHEFVGDDIHRQYTTFGGGGKVWVNRGATPWKVAGAVLPRFGFVAQSGKTVASVTERDGLTVGYAHSPGVTFVDSRPQSMDITGRAPVKTHVVSAKHLGNGQVEVEVEWQVLNPCPANTVVFVHVSHDKAAAQGKEKIALHPSMNLDPAKLQQPGTYRAITRFQLGEYDGEYLLRYGLYQRGDGGSRLVPIAYMDDTRVRGGIFNVKKQGAAVQSVEYVPEVPGPDAPRLNVEGKRVDFGGIVTNGAFRLLHSGSEWKLLPLQGSLPFQADLKLAALGAAGKRVAAVEAFEQSGKTIGTVQFAQQGDLVKLDLDAKAFGYRLKLR